jgi:hypothetical protein
MHHRRLAVAVLCSGALLAPAAAHAGSAPASVSSTPAAVSAHVKAARGSLLALRSAVASGDAARIRRALRRFTSEARLARRGALAASVGHANVRTAAALTDLLDAQTTAAGVFAELLDQVPADLQAPLAKALRDVLSGATPVSAALGDIAARLPEPARVAIAAALAELPLGDIDQLTSDVLAAAQPGATGDAATPILRDVVTLLTKLTQQATTGAKAALAEMPLSTLPAALAQLVQRAQTVVSDAAGAISGLPAVQGVAVAPLADAINSFLGVFAGRAAAMVPAAPAPAPAPATAPAPAGGLFSQIIGLLTLGRPNGV